MQDSGQTPALSLYDEAVSEADRFKWLESERCRYDVGFSAYHEWTRRYWPVFLRARRLDHLYGKRCYVEFEPELFGRFAQAANDPTIDFVASRFVDDCWENLHYFTTTVPSSCTADRLVQCLEVIGINRLRDMNPPLRLVGVA